MVNSPLVLVLAGGSGQRFWPLSRQDRPKQLIPLIDGRSLLEMSVDRALALTQADRVLVLTQENQLAATRALLPQLPAEQVQAEPQAHNTAAAIALGVAWALRRDEQAVMLVLPADHLIETTQAFVQTMREVQAVAQQQQALVTVGIPPTWASPSYGYLQRGPLLSLPGLEFAVHEVLRFREKPDPVLAGHFLEEGGFFWNAGIFAWSLPSIVAEMQAHAPALAQFALSLRHAPDLMQAAREGYGSLPKTSIDYALLEKASRVLCVVAGFQWDDLGTWRTLAKHLPTDSQGNGHHGPYAALSAENNLVFAQGPQLVALLGVKDLVVVSTADAVLVMDRTQGEALRELLPKLPPSLH